MNSQQVNNYYHLTVNNFHVSVVQSYNDFGKTNVRKILAKSYRSPSPSQNISFANSMNVLYSIIL